MKRIVNALGNLKLGNRLCAVVVLCATTAMVLRAQTFTTLFSFNGGDGKSPLAALVQGTNGYGYGTTALGGANTSTCPFWNCGGTIYEITPSGKLTTIYSFFDLTGGESPSGLIQATKGDFYGTTVFGGAQNSGTINKITPAGTLRTLYSFCAQSGCTDGRYPIAALVQATNGDFYGTTSGGGANGDYGTIFKIAASGKLTTLYNFCAQSGCPDGYVPYGALIQATNGDFYGTTSRGGANGDYGTVFKITPSGKLTTLYSFCSQGGSLCTDGEEPEAGLIQATNGDFYGTTAAGGAGQRVEPACSVGCGTIFKINAAGKLTTLYSFCAQTNCTDGEGPGFAGLIQGTDGNGYGTTEGGGASANCPYSQGCGTVFKITATGTLTTLYNFCSQANCVDGSQPEAGLVQATDGNFFGTTVYGGVTNYGTVFSLSTGLGPFVKTLPASGKVGAVVKILGTNLTGTTSVSFNGTPAKFNANSTGTAISTTVPTGATTGTVQVVTPSGTLSSNVPFRVLR